MLTPYSKINRVFRAIYPQQNPAAIKSAYNIPDTIHLEVELTPDGWFIAESPDYPGLFTQARSQQELLDMVNDAVLTYFDVPKRKADYIYDQISLEGLGTIRYQAKLQTT